eukprot:gene8032-5587_t
MCVYRYPLYLNFFLLLLLIRMTDTLHFHSRARGVQFNIRIFRTKQICHNTAIQTKNFALYFYSPPHTCMKSERASGTEVTRSPFARLPPPAPCAPRGLYSMKDVDTTLPPLAEEGPRPRPTPLDWNCDKGRKPAEGGADIERMATAKGKEGRNSRQSDSAVSSSSTAATAAWDPSCCTRVCRTPPSTLVAALPPTSSLPMHPFDPTAPVLRPRPRAPGAEDTDSCWCSHFFRCWWQGGRFQTLPTPFTPTESQALRQTCSQVATGFRDGLYGLLWEWFIANQKQLTRDHSPPSLLLELFVTTSRSVWYDRQRLFVADVRLRIAKATAKEEKAPIAPPSGFAQDEPTGPGNKQRETWSPETEAASPSRITRWATPKEVGLSTACYCQEGTLLHPQANSHPTASDGSFLLFRTAAVPSQQLARSILLTQALQFLLRDAHDFTAVIPSCSLHLNAFNTRDNVFELNGQTLMEQAMELLSAAQTTRPAAEVRRYVSPDADWTKYAGQDKTLTPEFVALMAAKRAFAADPSLTPFRWTLRNVSADQLSGPRSTLSVKEESETMTHFCFAFELYCVGAGCAGVRDDADPLSMPEAFSTAMSEYVGEPLTRVIYRCLMAASKQLRCAGLMADLWREFSVTCGPSCGAMNERIDFYFTAFFGPRRRSAGLSSKKKDQLPEPRAAAGVCSVTEEDDAGGVGGASRRQPVVLYDVETMRATVAPDGAIALLNDACVTDPNAVWGATLRLFVTRRSVAERGGGRYDEDEDEEEKNKRDGSSVEVCSVGPLVTARRRHAAAVRGLEVGGLHCFDFVAYEMARLLRHRLTALPCRERGRRRRGGGTTNSSTTATTTGAPRYPEEEAAAGLNASDVEEQFAHLAETVHHFAHLRAKEASSRAERPYPTLWTLAETETEAEAGLTGVGCGLHRTAVRGGKEEPQPGRGSMAPPLVEGLPYPFSRGASGADQAGRSEDLPHRGRPVKRPRDAEASHDDDDGLLGGEHSAAAPSYLLRSGVRSCAGAVVPAAPPPDTQPYDPDPPTGDGAGESLRGPEEEEEEWPAEYALAPAFSMNLLAGFGGGGLLLALWAPLYRPRLVLQTVPAAREATLVLARIDIYDSKEPAPSTAWRMGPAQEEDDRGWRRPSLASSSSSSCPPSPLFCFGGWGRGPAEALHRAWARMLPTVVLYRQFLQDLIQIAKKEAHHKISLFDSVLSTANEQRYSSFPFPIVCCSPSFFFFVDFLLLPSLQFKEDLRYLCRILDSLFFESSLFHFRLLINKDIPPKKNKNDNNNKKKTKNNQSCDLCSSASANGNGQKAHQQPTACSPNNNRDYIKFIYWHIYTYIYIFIQLRMRSTPRLHRLGV